MPLNFTTGPDDGVGYKADSYAEDEEDEEEGVVFYEEVEDDEQGEGG
jgi:hypothetical protein